MTLRQQLSLAALADWRGTRSGDATIAAATRLVDILEKRLGTSATTDDLSTEDVLALVADMRKEKAAPATITKRLGHLNVMAYRGATSRPPLCTYRTIPSVSVPNPVKPQWALALSKLPDLLEYLHMLGLEDLAWFIEWTCCTGLRVEETLGLRPKDIDIEAARIAPGGTKSIGSGDGLPLSKRAVELASSRMHLPRLMPCCYRTLADQWNVARRFLGEQDNPTATLKALRRSFAAAMHSRGAPTEAIRRAMRHADIRTTQRYLNVAGVASEDLRAYL